MKMLGCFKYSRFLSIFFATLPDGINLRSIEQQSQLLQGNKEKINDALEQAYPDGKIESTVNAFLINTGNGKKR